MKRYSAWCPLETLAERIKARRVERDMTCRDFEAFGVSASTISRVEAGQDVQLSNLTRIAKALGTTVVELLDGVSLDNYEGRGN